MTSCGKYQSSIEAQNACEEWAKEGGEFILQGVYVEYSYENLQKYGTGLRKTKGSTSNRPIRYCEEDAKTRKYLGVKHAKVKADEIIEVKCVKDAFICPSPFFEMGDAKVEKRFSY